MVVAQWLTPFPAGSFLGGACGDRRSHWHHLFILVILCWPLTAAAQWGAAPTAHIAYCVESPVTRSTVARTRFTTGQLSVLEALNRADTAHLSRLEALVVPQTWHEDLLAYSPFPMTYGWHAQAPKLLIVDQQAQAFGGYEAGRLVRWGPVSSGRRTHQTPAGLFHLNWRARGRHSTVDPDWFMPWYFNFHNERGLSFHEYSLPGRPASHACVRLLERDARWLFEWGDGWTLDDRGWIVLDPGTPVLILGCYDFSAAPPWRSVAWLAVGVDLPADPSITRHECGPEV